MEVETVTMTPDNLFAGQVAPVVAGSETIVSGAGALARGTVLGRITASGKLTKVLSTANDGSEAPYAVLAEAVDATAADKVAPVYYTGEFNQAKLTFGGADTAATHKVASRKLGMFFKSAVSA